MLLETNYTYDDRRLLESVIVGDNGTIDSATRSFGYHGNGNLSEEYDFFGTLHRRIKYDSHDRSILVTEAAGAPLQTI